MIPVTQQLGYIVILFVSFDYILSKDTTMGFAEKAGFLQLYLIELFDIQIVISVLYPSSSIFIVQIYKMAATILVLHFERYII